MAGQIQQWYDFPHILHGAALAVNTCHVLTQGTNWYDRVSSYANISTYDNDERALC
jgi:hypothetical protein